MSIEPDYLREPLLVSGKKRLLGFILLTLASDVLVKIFAYIAGTLKISQLIGTVLTAVLLIFIWQGSRAAWWIAVMFLSLAALFGLYMIVSVNAWAGSLVLCFVLAQSWLLTSKAVRTFMTDQRETAFR